MTPAPSATERYTFIDALRGVAATMVVVGHAVAFSAVNAPLLKLMPSPLAYAVENYAARGVQIFFVISGFVIAHSLRNTPMTWRGCGRFMARRQLRLDPPYWAMIVIMLGVIAVRTRGGAAGVIQFPTPGTIAANAVYLQGVLRLQDIIIIGWTLAIEIQFYVAFLLILAIGRTATPTPTTLTLLLLTSTAALFTDPNITWAARWAVHAWPYFVAGVTCYWAVRRQTTAWPLAVALGGLLASAVHFGLQSQVVTGVGTTLAIFIVGRSNRLHTLWRNAVIQFLGRISYSLYLTHMVIILVAQQAAYRLVHGAVMSWTFTTAAVLAAVAIAYPFHRLIEVPSMRLAGRFKQDCGPSAATGFGEALPPAEDEAAALATSFR